MLLVEGRQAIELDILTNTLLFFTLFPYNYIPFLNLLSLKTYLNYNFVVDLGGARTISSFCVSSVMAAKKENRKRSKVLRPLQTFSNYETI